MSVPVILDVDTGVDDALAILFAVRHPGIDVLGISCVAGNAALAQVVDNTLRILDVAGGPTIPVAAGAVRPAARARHARPGTCTAPTGSAEIALRRRRDAPSRSAPWS